MDTGDVATTRRALRIIVMIFLLSMGTISLTGGWVSVQRVPKPEDDCDEVADCFSTQTNPAITPSRPKAETEARIAVEPGYSAKPLAAAPAPQLNPPAG